ARHNARTAELSHLDPMSLECSNGEPLLYCHRPCTVKGFLECLLQERWIEEIRSSSPDLWKVFGNSWINFSHFSEDFGHGAAQDSLSLRGLLAAYLRGRAIVCKQGQRGIDLAIPMIVLPEGSALQTLINLS